MIHTPLVINKVRFGCLCQPHLLCLAIWNGANYIRVKLWDLCFRNCINKVHFGCLCQPHSLIEFRYLKWCNYIQAKLSHLCFRDCINKVHFGCLCQPHLLSLGIWNDAIIFEPNCHTCVLEIVLIRCALGCLCQPHLLGLGIWNDAIIFESNHHICVLEIVHIGT